MYLIISQEWRSTYYNEVPFLPPSNAGDGRTAKRENPDIQEDLVLIRALRDSNLPKFLADDATLLQGREVKIMTPEYIYS